VIPTLSIAVPTHNRAALWRSGWLLDGLRELAQPDLELLIVDDHSTDDTIVVLTDVLSARPLAYPVTLARCLTPPTSDNRASAAPDQVGFGLATAPLLLHLDDDLRIDPRLVDFILDLDLTRRVLWLQLSFATPDGKPMHGTFSRDSRARYAHGHNAIAPLCPHRELHWGPAFCAPTRELRAIGGHNLEHRGYRNSDTRLGRRLVNHGCQSLLAVDPRGFATHLGPTWYRAHQRDRALVRASRRPPTDEPTIANGGAAYFDSPDFRSSFEILARFPG
jgi:glycosyltransferase involved in cell wall biosynthesis